MTEQATDLAEVQEERKMMGIPIEDDGAFSNLLDTGRFEHMYRVAQLFASSTLVPDHFKGSPANCFIAVQMAVRLQVEPFTMLQKTYVIGGRPGIEAQLAIALFNKRGPFKSRIKYEMTGTIGADDRACTAFAIDEDGDRLEETVSIKMAKEAGWYDRKDRNGNFCSLWRKVPELMLKYRAAMYLVRVNAPEVLMGMLSVEELEDVGPQRESFNPDAADGAQGVEAVKRRLAAKPGAEVVATVEATDPPQTAEAAQEAPAGAGKEEPAPVEPYFRGVVFEDSDREAEAEERFRTLVSLIGEETSADIDFAEELAHAWLHQKKPDLDCITDDGKWRTRIMSAAKRVKWNERMTKAVL